MSYILPSVEYVENGIIKSANPYSFMLNERVVFLNTAVTEYSSNAIVAQLLALEKKDPTQDIDLYINSGGGIVTGGLAIYDTMNLINCKVNTVCLGQACSMGAFLLAAGTGKRYATKNSRVMIHQILGGANGQATDVEIQWHEMKRLKELLTTIMSNNSKLTYEVMLQECERDNFLVPEKALSYGLIDIIL